MVASGSAPPAQKPSVGSIAKRVLVGRSLSSYRLEHTLLPKLLALPVFSSDALSSVAYATEEILRVLLITTAGTQHLVIPIAIAIAALMLIVVASYRQTVRAYPNGGGAYIVSKENLGVVPGLVAAAALLTDYVLTVSVSVAAGVFAMTSAIPSLAEHRVLISLGFILFITLANLRGVRESGVLFAFPTYAFIASVMVLIAVGLTRCLISGCPQVQNPIPPETDLAMTVMPIGIFVILHAFSSGSTALTGVEAISNGVPAFRRPQARNAADTLAIMGAMSVTMFLGISFLASHIHGITVNGAERSVVAQIADALFGQGWFFYIVQFFTTAILILAANTSFQDFPRLSSILARDRFMPRQFANRGDRLVFSNGVIVLAVSASVLIYAFDADVNRLIQLYVVGVFTSFTLSQSGMVRHWLKQRRKGGPAASGWRRAMVINGIGAVATALVLVIVTYTKFAEGAWIVIWAIPVIVFVFLSIRRHYDAVMAQLRRGRIRPDITGANHVVLLVFELNAATAEAVGYVRAVRPADVRLLHPCDGTVPIGLQEQWRSFVPGAPELQALPVRHGELVQAVRTAIRGIPRDPDDFVTVVVPELVKPGLPAYLLRSRTLVRLKSALLREPGVVVTDVPVIVRQDAPVGVHGRPLIPNRTEALVFVSAVHDATIRAVEYARTLGAANTRAIYFDLDPDESTRMEEEWAELRLGIPLEVVEAPFRDLSGPMLEEVRRITARPDTLAIVVIPELIVKKWRHFLLHNQNALFVKRLFLFEPRCVLSSVPFVLEAGSARPESVQGPVRS